MRDPEAQHQQFELLTFPKAHPKRESKIFQGDIRRDSGSFRFSSKVSLVSY